METSEKKPLDLLTSKQPDWTSNRVILTSVFKFLNLSDLKSVRKVNKIWYRAVRSAVARRSQVEISITGDVIQSHVNSFMEQFPVDSSFGFNFRLGSNESVFCHDLADLPVSAVLTNLVLHFDATPEVTRTVNCLLANIVAGFPSLKCLELNFNDNMFQHSGQLMASEPSLESVKPRRTIASLETLKIRFGFWGIDWSFLESLAKLQVLHILSLDHGSRNWIKNTRLISSALAARQAPSDLQYILISTKKYDYKQPWTSETQQSLSSFLEALNSEILVWDLTPEFFVPRHPDIFWIPFPETVMVQATIMNTATVTAKQLHRRQENKKFLRTISVLMKRRGDRTQQTCLFLHVNIQVQIGGSKCVNTFIQVEQDVAKDTLVIRVGKVSEETRTEVEDVFYTMYRYWVLFRGQNYTTLRCYDFGEHQEAETDKRFQYACNIIFGGIPREHSVRTWYQTDFTGTETNVVSRCGPTWSACQQEASYALVYSEE